MSEYYPNGEVKNPKLSYGIGEELHLTCDPGYVMDGPSSLTCLGTLTSSNLLTFTYDIDLYNLRALGRISQAEAWSCKQGTLHFSNFKQIYTT